jgi:hypothetical protein
MKFIKFQLDEHLYIPEGIKEVYLDGTIKNKQNKYNGSKIILPQTVKDVGFYWSNSSKTGLLTTSHLIKYIEFYNGKKEILDEIRQYIPKCETFYFDGSRDFGYFHS